MVRRSGVYSYQGPDPPRSAIHRSFSSRFDGVREWAYTQDVDGVGQVQLSRQRLDTLLHRWNAYRTGQIVDDDGQGPRCRTKKRPTFTYNNAEHPFNDHLEGILLLLRINKGDVGALLDRQLFGDYPYVAREDILSALKRTGVIAITPEAPAPPISP